jgi:hypothetical protein
MDEDEWQTCNDPISMLHTLRGISSMRKLRLFACACCRRVWQELSDDRSRSVVEVAEKFADDRVGAKELDVAREAAYSVHANTTSPDSGFPDAAKGMSRSNWEAAQAATLTAMAFGTSDDAIWCGQATVEQTSLAAASSAQVGHGLADISEGGGEEKERAFQADVLRCIFGNPFRPPSVAPSWLTPTIVTLAQAIYENRSLPDGVLSNAQLAVLVDALEKVGCANPELLSHCRGAQLHARGCWVVDLILTRDR